MPYLLDESGTQLLVLDGFGLTRVSVPDRVKTDRSVQGVLGATLSATPDVGRVMAFDGTFGARVRVADFPSLGNAVTVPRFVGDYAAIHPDGARLVVFGNWLSYEPEGRARVVRIKNDKRDIVSDVDYATRDAPTLPAVNLGLGGARPLRRLYALAPDGTFAHHIGRDRDQVFVGRIAPDDAAMSVLFSFPLAVDPGDVVALHPGRGGVTVVAWSPRAQRGRVVRVEAGQPLRVVERACVSPPSPATGGAGHGGVFWQTHDDRFLHTDGDGAEREAYTLADTGHTGPGLVAARGARVWFVPWHGEAILDLGVKRVVPRKLPPREHPVRAYLTRHLRDVRVVAAAANLHLTLEGLTFHAREPRYTWRVGTSGGDGSLLAHIVDAQLARGPAADLVHGGFPVTMPSTWGYGVPADRVFDADSVTAALTHLAAHGASSLTTLDALRRLYVDRLGATLRDARPAPLTPAADARWLARVTSSLLGHDAPATETPSPADVVRALDALDEATVRAHQHTVTLGIALLALRVFGAASAEVFVHLLARTSRVPGAVNYELRDTLAALLAAYPDTRVAVKRVYDAGPPPGAEDLWANLGLMFDP